MTLFRRSIFRIRRIFPHVRLRMPVGSVHNTSSYSVLAQQSAPNLRDLSDASLVKAAKKHLDNAAENGERIDKNPYKSDIRNAYELLKEMYERVENNSDNQELKNQYMELLKKYHDLTYPDCPPVKDFSEPPPPSFDGARPRRAPEQPPDAPSSTEPEAFPPASAPLPQDTSVALLRENLRKSI